MWRWLARVAALACLLAGCGGSPAAHHSGGRGQAQIFPVPPHHPFGPAGQQTGCSPTVGTTMTNTVSHLCGFADTTNTGPPAGATLYRVPQDITAPTAQTGHGWVYSGGSLDIPAGALATNISCACDVTFDGDGGTLQDSDITFGTGNGSYPISIRHASHLTIQSDNIHGPAATGSYCDNGIRDIYQDSEDLTIRDNNIWFCSSPLNNITNGGLIELNYLHDFGGAGTAEHANGLQFEPGSGLLMTVRDNTILNKFNQTDAIILSNDIFPNPIPESNRYITHNLLAGGGYCFYGQGGPSEPVGATSNHIQFTNNSFSRLYYPGCGSTGLSSGPYPSDNGWDLYWVTDPTNTWSGNIWDDTGASVAP